MRLLTRAVATAIPAFGELTLDRLAATATQPGFFHRLQRRQGLLEDRLRFGDFIIVDDPELRPALDWRQFAGGAAEVEISRNAPDAERRQNVLKVTDHQWIFGAVDPLHPPFVKSLRATPQCFFVQF